MPTRKRGCETGKGEKGMNAHSWVVVIIREWGLDTPQNCHTERWHSLASIPYLSRIVLRVLTLQHLQSTLHTCRWRQGQTDSPSLWGGIVGYEGGMNNIYFKWQPKHGHMAIRTEKKTGRERKSHKGRAKLRLPLSQIRPSSKLLHSLLPFCDSTHNLSYQMHLHCKENKEKASTPAECHIKKWFLLYFR